jgi:hypothetical protein
MISDSLHARARAFVRAYEGQRPVPEPFDALACDLARFQAAHVPGYARLCEARGLDLTRLTRAADAPAVPTDAFKLARIATFPESETARTFRTSGTTIGARGAHAMRDVATYDMEALAFGRQMLARDLPARVPVLVVGQSPEEAPESSLTHMIALFVGAFGDPATSGYFLRGEQLASDALAARIASLAPEVPALVLGTSFGFVHLLDALAGAVLPLPAGSRLMHTGGYKGRSREVAPAELRAELARTFAIDPRAVITEYGMTELTSQFYEATLVDPDAPHGVYVEPPWARVVPVDPERLHPVPEGEVGIARIEDLMNVDSAWAILAADRVRRVRLPAGGTGFELLGRAPGAPPRGCSIAVDEILGGA